MSESNWLQSSVANAYGGSMKITSNAADFAEPPAASAFEAERAAPEATYFSALALMTRAVMPRSHERFRCSAVNVLAISAAAGAEDSTATSSLAPRLNASMPSAPVPANRSNTRASSSPCHESRCENIASLVRSVVGRVPVFGVVNATPLNRPEITCMTPLWPPRRNDRNRTTGPAWSYVPYIRRLRYATQLAHMPHML